MKKALKLILCEVAAGPKQIVDKNTGQTILRWRHVFMTPEGTELIGWSENDGYRTRTQPSLEWNPELAQVFLFDSRQWEGNERLRLIERTQADAYLRGIEKANTSKK